MLQVVFPTEIKQNIKSYDYLCKFINLVFALINKLLGLGSDHLWVLNGYAFILNIVQKTTNYVWGWFFWCVITFRLQLLVFANKNRILQPLSKDGVRAKTALGQSSFKSAASCEWNLLPRHLRDITSMQTFKSKLFNYFLNLDLPVHVCSVR